MPFFAWIMKLTKKALYWSTHNQYPGLFFVPYRRSWRYFVILKREHRGLGVVVAAVAVPAAAVVLETLNYRTYIYRYTVRSKVVVNTPTVCMTAPYSRHIMSLPFIIPVVCKVLTTGTRSFFRQRKLFKVILKDRSGYTKNISYPSPSSYLSKPQ